MVLLSLGSCTNPVERSSLGLLQRSQKDPTISGNGEKLAVIIDQLGRPTVQLQDLKNGNILPLRHLSRHQPHSSPSLSWNARYLAVIIQRGNRRIAVIEDRLKGKLHSLNLPREKVPVSINLSPDARQIAIQVAEQGKWRIELFNLKGKIEPDEQSGLSLRTPLTQ